MGMMTELNENVATITYILKKNRRYGWRDGIHGQALRQRIASDYLAVFPGNGDLFVSNYEFLVKQGFVE